MGITVRAMGIAVVSRFCTSTPTDIKPAIKERVTMRETLRWSRETVTIEPGFKVEP